MKNADLIAYFIFVTIAVVVGTGYYAFQEYNKTKLEMARIQNGCQVESVIDSSKSN